MTKAEIDKLCLLLKQFYPKKNYSDNFKLSWKMALEPYSYDQVKNAVLEHVRESQFFPDIYDLTKRLPSPKKDDKDSDRSECLLKYLKDFRKRNEGIEVNPVTHYAAENGLTIGEAERVMGITWAEAADKRCRGEENGT